MDRSLFFCKVRAKIAGIFCCDALDGVACFPILVSFPESVVAKRAAEKNQYSVLSGLSIQASKARIASVERSRSEWSLLWTGSFSNSW